MDGRPIRAIGLGAMRLSIQGRPEYDQAREVIKAFLDYGGNLIDTADVYCLDDTERGHNETLLVNILTELDALDRVTIATKGGMYRPQGEWRVDARPEILRQSCENSLKRLGFEPIELYQLHTVDRQVPLEESVGELTRLQEEGKIRYIGLSNVNLDQLRTAQKMTEIATVQNQFNLKKTDDLHNGLLAYCLRQKINYLPYRPLGARLVQQHLLQNKILNRLADKYHCTPQQLMLGWLLNLGEHVLPIPGTANPEHMRQLMETVNFTFSEDDLLELEDSLDLD